MNILISILKLLLKIIGLAFYIIPIIYGFIKNIDYAYIFLTMFSFTLGASFIMFSDAIKKK